MIELHHYSIGSFSQNLLTELYGKCSENILEILKFKQINFQFLIYLETAGNTVVLQNKTKQKAIHFQATEILPDTSEDKRK